MILTNLLDAVHQKTYPHDSNVKIISRVETSIYRVSEALLRGIDSLVLVAAGAGESLRVRVPATANTRLSPAATAF